MKKLGIVFVGMFLLMAFSLTGCYQNHKAPAEANAKAFAEKMIPNWKAVDCVNMDTDMDGYVSCTVSVVNTDGTPNTAIALECVGEQPPWNFVKNTGCRSPALKGPLY